MQKIAVARTIARAYGFLFGRIFSIIGLAWLPALIYAGGAYLLPPHLDSVMRSAHASTGTMVQNVFVYLGLVAAVFLLHAVIAISLTQQALGMRKEFALAHFVVGPRELRLTLAYLRLYVIFIVGCIALGAGAALGTMQAMQFAAAGGKTALSVNGVSLLPAGFVVVVLVLVVAFLLMILRLAFLIAPVAAVAQRASLVQSWRLTSGSGWRIVVVVLCVFVPVLLLAATGLWLWSGNALLSAVHDMMATQPLDATILARFEATHAFGLAAAGGVVLIIMAALQAGATAEAYRTVTGHDEADDAPAMAHHDDDHGHESEAPTFEHDAEDHGHGHQDEGHGEADHNHHGPTDEDAPHEHHAQASADEHPIGESAAHEGDHDVHAVQEETGGEHHVEEQSEGASDEGHMAHPADEATEHHGEEEVGHDLEPDGHDAHAAAA